LGSRTPGTSKTAATFGEPLTGESSFVQKPTGKEKIKRSEKKVEEPSAGLPRTKTKRG